MKRVLLATVLVLLSLFAASAQDVITCIDGTDIIANVLEIKADGVYFKYFGEPQDQTYRLPESSILMITYATGQTYIFPAGYNVLETLAKANQTPVPEPVKKKCCCLFRCRKR